MIVDSVGDGKQAKAMRARGKQIMKALGRADIQLDEYESMSLFSALRLSY
jgi:hypothetical protein